MGFGLWWEVADCSSSPVMWCILLIVKGNDREILALTKWFHGFDSQLVDILVNNCQKKKRFSNIYIVRHCAYSQFWWNHPP